MTETPPGTGDLATLEGLLAAARPRLEVTAIEPGRDAVPYLVLRARDGSARAAVALARSTIECPSLPAAAPDLPARIDRAWLQRCAVIDVRGGAP